MLITQSFWFFQEEYQKLKSNEQQELVQNYEEFKGLFGKSQEELLDESNPFFESSQDGNNPFEEENASSTNPFDDDEVEDEYDQSGKNPFAWIETKRPLLVQ